jgi:hypothetical protein
MGNSELFAKNGLFLFGFNLNKDKLAEEFKNTNYIRS